jgi:hypothetical protein
MGNALVSMAGVRRSSTLRAGLLQFGRIDWAQHGLATDPARLSTLLAEVGH